MSAGHDPADCDAPVFFNHMLNIKIQIGECVSGVERTLAECLVVDGLTTPWVVFIFTDAVLRRNQFIQAAEISFIPDFLHELTEYLLSLYLFHFIVAVFRVVAQGRLLNRFKLIFPLI